MYIRYRVVRLCRQDDWEIILADAPIKLETNSLPVTFKTKVQAQKWIDFINARDLITGRRKRKPGRVKYKQHRVCLSPETLDLDDRSRLKNIEEKPVEAGSIISRNTKHRLNAILKLSIGD